MSLQEYRRKRRFDRTPEPAPSDPSHSSSKSTKAKSSKVKATQPQAAGPGQRLRFVIQKHDASRLHYDFRLEIDGVLKSWAVPKGPSLDPHEKRLAVEVEDHPLAYGDFEGVIPPDEYGGGTVLLWDRGWWESLDGEPSASWQSGKLKLQLHGEKLHGGWTLVRMGGPANRDGRNWLLIKERDDQQRPLDAGDVLDEAPQSVKTGRSLDEIAEEASDVWSSREPARKKTATVSKAARKKAAKKKAAKKKVAKKKIAKKTATRKSAKKAPKKAVVRKPPQTTRSARRTNAATPARLAAPPEFVAPQLATLVDRAPAGDEWAHEIKFDGYRLLCRIDDDRVRLLTRNRQDWTARFPSIAQAAAEFARQAGLANALLDGEVAALNDQGATDFQALQNSLRDRSDGRLAYYVFDLLFVDGQDLRGQALEQRKSRLAELLNPLGQEGRIRYVEHVVGAGPEFFAAASGQGLEGIICKRLAAPYRSGRAPSWLKVKAIQQAEFVIGGYTDPAGARERFGALLLGFYDSQGKLQYAGRVGTGFRQSTLDDLHRRMKPLHRDDSPFANLTPRQAGRGAHFVQPRLVAQVAFTQWTRDGLLRHPAYLGLREDKPAREVGREAPSATPEIARAAMPAADSTSKRRTARAKEQGKPTSGKAGAAAEAIDVAGVRLTSPDKVMYPEQQATKLHLAEYYQQVADWMLPHVGGRLLSLVRCPAGRRKACFFQKHATAGVTEHVRRVTVEEKNGSAEYLMIDDLAGLIALVQVGVLEIHVWGSLAEAPDKPDRLVIDLDPDPELPWPSVIDTARQLHDLLAEAGLTSFVKTTGGKGLHVVLPLVRRHAWAEVKQFARGLANLLARLAPDRYTASASKAARSGKIYVDYLRNDRGATAIAPFSTRARPGAPVSVPLSWDELADQARPDAFHIANLPQRLAGLSRDPWSGFFEVRQSITAAARKKLQLPDDG